MVSIKDIQKSITLKLKDLDIEVYANDVKEGFNTPCFFVNIEKYENSLENSNMVKKYLDIYIRYINENILDTERLEVTEKLDNLFIKILEVKDRVFTIHNKSFSKGEKDYVEFNFGIEYYDFLCSEEETGSELLRVVDLKFKSL